MDEALIEGAVLRVRPLAMTAGVILQERQHRSLIYRANYPAIGKDLVHNTFNCKQFFFRHKPIVRVRRDAPDHASRG
jgi:hypothetical protein